MRRAKPLVLLAFAPAVVGALIAVWMLVAGDTRTLELGIRLPALVAFSAVALALVAALLLLTHARTARAAARATAEARSAAGQEAAFAHRRFLDRLDHELKNPLMAMRSAVAASVPRTPQLGVIDTQSKRLGALVAELRKLSELESAPLDFETVSLETVTRDVADAVRAQFGRSMHVDFPAAPWPLPTIDGDPDLLYIAIYNLAVNAAKYSAPDARIEVRASEELAGQPGAVVHLDVADTGRGIPVADLPSVWEELARGGNSRDVQGSGLGLALVTVIVRRHGGSVALTSREGSGTRVRLTLPVLRAR